MELLRWRFCLLGEGSSTSAPSPLPSLPPFGVFGTLLRLFGVFLGVLAGVPSGVLVMPALPGSYSDNLRFALRYITPAEEPDL